MAFSAGLGETKRFEISMLPTVQDTLGSFSDRPASLYIFTASCQGFKAR